MSDGVVVPHPALEPAEMYDGPIPGQTPPPPQIRPQPQQPSLSVQQRQQIVAAQILSTVRTGLALLAARLLGFFAVSTACGVWAYAVINPDTPRTLAAVGYSFTVLMPVMYFYLKKG